MILIPYFFRGASKKIDGVQTLFVWYIPTVSRLSKMSVIPGDFSFITDPLTKMLLEDAYQAVTMSNSWTALRDTSPPDDKGFMFSVSPTTDAIDKLMRFLDQHSGASYALTMRSMEAIAKKGWVEFVKSHQSYSSDPVPIYYTSTLGPAPSSIEDHSHCGNNCSLKHAD